MELAFASEGKFYGGEFFFIDQFPLTGSGKIQKFKLKEMSLELCKKQGIEVV